MKEKGISIFMLECYRLDELNPQDKKEVEDALAKDAGLRSALEELDKSDRELRLRYPASSVGIEELAFQKKRFTMAKIKVSILAAAVLLCVLLPVFILNKKTTGITIVASIDEKDFQTDRPKGQLPTGSEIFIYLKGDTKEALHETDLHNRRLLHEGDTVQLAYTAPAGAQYYGVIFSIDGRSVVTTHYPYLRGQSSLLVSGRQTFLDEAYTLDDAPDYEVFVFVVSEQPLDPNTVNAQAEKIAHKAGTAEQIKEISEEVFNACEIETITVLKK
ncbi:MAG: hypothetical protein LBI04_04955 [Treponema sp.]|jgi:hypothetical protein|nr:hypothetical protein [Treponema sp.]